MSRPSAPAAASYPLFGLPPAYLSPTLTFWPSLPFSYAILTSIPTFLQSCHSPAWWQIAHLLLATHVSLLIVMKCFWKCLFACFLYVQVFCLSVMSTLCPTLLNASSPFPSLVLVPFRFLSVDVNIHNIIDLPILSGFLSFNRTFASTSNLN